MIKPSEIIRYTGHVTALTESLRSKCGTIRIASGALKSAESLMENGRKIEKLSGRDLRVCLEKILSEFHKIEFFTDTLYTSGNISDEAYKALSGEASSLRNSLLKSITELRK